MVHFPANTHTPVASFPPATARGSTDWITVDAVDDPVAIPCFAALLHEYYTLSEHLPRFDDRLFLSSFADRAHEGKLWGLSSDRLAKLMKAAMIAAGIPAEFLPHSARHAGIAHWRDGR